MEWSIKWERSDFGFPNSEFDKQDRVRVRTDPKYRESQTQRSQAPVSAEQEIRA
jgi:hypothetical protein